MLKDFVEKYMLNSRGAVEGKRLEKWYVDSGVGELWCRVRDLLPHRHVTQNARIIMENNGSELCKICKTNVIPEKLIQGPNTYVCVECRKSTKSANIKSINEAKRALKPLKLSKSKHEYGFGSEAFKNAMIQKHGVENISQSQKVKDGKVHNSLEKWGVTNVAQAQEVKDIAKKNSLEKWGAPSFFESDEFKEANHHEEWNNRNISETGRKYLSDVHEMYRIYNDEKLMLGELSLKVEVPVQTIARRFAAANLPLRTEYSSMEEKAFANSVEKIDSSMIRSFRKSGFAKEVDIWFPALDLAIDYHGLYWHSVGHTKVDLRHRNKAVKSIELGKRILQFWSHEVSHKNDIVMSMIASKLGKTEKIFARKCVVSPLGSTDYTAFCEANHIHGSVGASVRLGLFYENTLVSVMSFGKSRYDKKIDWEMIRFCTLKGFTVVGGASKLWKHFVKNWKPSSVATYADARFSDGSFYTKIGFSLVHHSSPNYWYTRDFQKLESRVKYQKHKLSKLLENFDPSLTEKENMIANGYRIVYDAGNFVFVWKK